MERVFDEGVDVLVFVYSSKTVNQIQQIMGKNFNDVAEKFKEWNIDTLTVASYDVNTENYPPGIDSHDIPMIYFYPAYHKRPPYLRFL